MTEIVRLPGLLLIDHEIEVPLDHAAPDGESITVFAREVAAPDGRDRPFLVFLQGGPGCEAPRPTRVPSSPPWLERALADYRVVMLDQRFTGRSTPVGAAAVDTWGAAGLAERLTHARADAIVADAEAMREHLGVAQWSLLGQSFGGFTALAYLSAAASSLREVFFTGGLPPVGRHPDEVYARTFAAMRRKSQAFYRRFPGDRQRMRDLVAAADDGQVRLSDGERVSGQRLRTLGHALGASGGPESLHYLLEGEVRSPAFRHDLGAALPFGDRNPLYAVVHESSYADGHATRWSAERVMPQDFHDDVTLLFGEHLFPWHFTESRALFPFAQVAQRLAEQPWPALYDAAALRAAEVPCAAAIYADDAYVDREFSEETAALLPRMRAWVTNEYEHNGLRADGGRVLDRLIRLARDETV